MTDITTSAANETLEGLLNAFFHAVSFQRGEKPPYATLLDLFIEGGRLIKNSAASPEIMTIDQCIAPRQQMVDSGEMMAFQEVEIAEITQVFGNIAHRLSLYEKRGTMNGAAFEGKGVISTQFIRTPRGWKISSMAWDDERPGLSIPDSLIRTA